MVGLFTYVANVWHNQKYRHNFPHIIFDLNEINGARAYVVEVIRMY
jgi:hypothetical protein